MKYIKGLILCIGILFILSLILTIFSYFDMFKANTINILKIITITLSFLIGGIYVGLNSKKKGYIEGIKFSLLFIIVSLLFILSLPNIKLNLKTFLYYVIITFISIIGSMIGINKKKVKN